MRRSLPLLALLALVACGVDVVAPAADDADAASAPEVAAVVDVATEDVPAAVEDVGPGLEDAYEAPEDAAAPADLAPADLPPPGEDVLPVEIGPLILRCASGVLPGTVPAAAWTVEVRSTDDPGLRALHLERDVAHAHDNLPVTSGKQVVDVLAESSITPLTWSLTFDGGQLDLSQGPAGAPFWSGPGTIGADELLTMHCWPPDLALAFTYQPELGACRDAEGAGGFNQGVPLAYVRETGDGHCVDLGGKDLGDGDTAYPKLEEWDLRGARLEASQLHFAFLLDARLEGADLDGLQYGYAMVTGTIDGATKLPPGCTVDEEHLATCSQ